MIHHKIINFEIKNDSLGASISLGLITLALIGAYLPGRISSFFIVPALFVLWAARRHICVDSTIRLIFLLYGAYLIIFTITSQNILRSIDGIYHIFRGLLFFPLALIFAQFVRQRGSLLVNILAVLLIVGNFFFQRDYSFAANAQGYFFSYYQNPNNAGVHLVGLLVLTIPYASAFKLRLPHWVSSFVGVATGIFLLSLTNARGAWIGLVGGVIVLLGVKRQFSFWIRVSMGLLCLAGLVALFLLFNLKGFQLTNRQELWKGLFEATSQEHLLMGYGIEMVKPVINQKQLITVTAHNMFLEIFVCSGLVGTAWIVSLIVYLIRHLQGFSYQQNTLWCMGLIGLSVFLIMAQFDLKFFAYRFNASISFFLGLIYSQRFIDHNDRQESNGLQNKPV